MDDILVEFNTNIFSAVFLTKAMVAKKNRQEKLSLVYISSIAAKTGMPGALTYAMTKASLNSLVLSLAQEVGEKKVRVNAIMPGGCDTPMASTYNDVLPYDYLEKVKAKNIYHEAMKPENVADLAVFLLSDKAKWIHGQCLTIDGGETLA
ncbi:MAG: SDR family oxidoreductase [Alphaproteobacteria bacterium]